MTYTDHTREKLIAGYKDTWKRRLLLSFSGVRELAGQMEGFGEGRPDDALVEAAQEAYIKNGKGPLSAFFQKEYRKLAKAFVGKEYLGDYCHMLDKLTAFPYSGGWYRRTVRSDEYLPFMEHAFRLMYDYRSLDFFGGSLKRYLQNDLPEELLDLKRHNRIFCPMYLEDMIAARIDAKDEEIFSLIREMLLSDNNTAILTVEVIRGILKGSDPGLHRLLADFLLAARLQEGARQAVCENADCGTVEGFLTIFHTICDHNLIRYAAVKRAVATWIGIGGEDPDRISAKLLADIRPAAADAETALAFTQSNDSIHIMTGLWALGQRNVKDAIEVMKGYLEHGTKNQILTMSYYNRCLEYQGFSQAVAKRAIKKYADAQEDALLYTAAFLPTYLDTVDRLVREAVRHKPGEEGAAIYYPIPFHRLFQEKEEAREHFGYLKAIYERMPKKRMVFSPCIFPWYQVEISKSELAKRMCCIAYMLQDMQLMRAAGSCLGEIDGGGAYGGRGVYLELMLHQLDSGWEVDCVIRFLADKEEATRNAAYHILKDIELTPEQYRQLEDFLRYKNSSLRAHVIRLLSSRETGQLAESVGRLLSTGRQEQREGGLSLALAVKKDGRDIAPLLAIVKGLPDATAKEKVLIGEILGDSPTESILSQAGYGLYEPGSGPEFPKEVCDAEFLHSYMDISSRKLSDIIEKLKELLEREKYLEYRAANGETRLLGNCFHQITWGDSLPMDQRYPFRELWVDFYKKEIRDPDTLNLLLLAVQPGAGYRPEEMTLTLRSILGGIVDYNSSYRPYCPDSHTDHVRLILQILQSIYGMGDMPRAALEALRYILTEVPEQSLWYKRVHPATAYRSAYTENVSLIRDFMCFPLVTMVMEREDDQWFLEIFPCLYQLDCRFCFHKNESGRQQMYYYSNDCPNLLSIFDYIKACSMGMIPEDTVFEAMFETYGLRYSFGELGALYAEKLTRYQLLRLNRFLTGEERRSQALDHSTAFYQTGDRIYQKAVDRILDVELKRGELPTVFSESVMNIQRFFGMGRFVQILAALGNEKLDRTQHYWARLQSPSRQVTFSHLLRACYPLPEDDACRLATLLADAGVGRQRLIEVSMYAPQWMDIVEGYLKIPGFKLGCYYFMAHMNDSFDDRKKAVIARYTPLSPEELNRGAFDVNWFEEAYGMLGEGNFRRLYEAAKYISDGSRHSRARKYADAALGRVTAEALEQAITEKRNKDLLMSYALLPMHGKEDMVKRYEFIQRFLKESRQFGALRKASEAEAVAMALRNLATKAGYEDTTRLTLAMETELIKSYEKCFRWQEMGGVRVRIELDSLGKAALACERDGKKLKSIPAACRKEPLALEMKEVNKKLKEQHARTVKMFEASMETSEWFRFDEIRGFCENPVAAAVIGGLVFFQEQGFFGFICEDGLTDAAGITQSCRAEDRIRAAHPFDLYQAKVWGEYQGYFYRQASQGEMKKQPFKQVFRELYVKLPEEMGMPYSRMFAGNQIQPAKTAACLKGRGWVADYEDGLQKVYYKDDIVARMYALADWFSPSDIQAPALEWVEFTHRKTFRQIPVGDVPDIIYSEVMRDVDLAVSVAHVGGVDPETSHSTIEMRRVIISFNLPLFGIKNVALKGSHAIISGKLGEYSVHLGSGVIHQVGGRQINVLPVHSQKRGKIFLPFVDEDPKTAEIMSKIVLFAGDEKIKDPYILDQITG